jgi:hypothetical protein
MQMKTKIENLEHAKQVFNTISILRGQYVNIATADKSGSPNVAPIGSMRIAEDGTIHVLQGFLPRTMKNLREQPKAVFSVCFRKSLLDMILFLKEKDDAALGYQVYSTLRAVSDSHSDVLKEAEAISSRVPFFMRKPFRKFCDKNLKRLLTFSIDEIREIGGPV